LAQLKLAGLKRFDSLARCTLCGLCESRCPLGAINLKNQEINPENLNKPGVQSGKTFSLVAPSMIAEGLKRAKLMGINSKAAFLENADVIFKGVKDDIRNNQFFKNIAPNFYQVAANIYEDRLKNFVPPSAATSSVTPTAPTPSTPVTSITTMPAGR
jgi:ferredoxin